MAVVLTNTDLYEIHQVRGVGGATAILDCLQSNSIEPRASIVRPPITASLYSKIGWMMFGEPYFGFDTLALDQLENHFNTAANFGAAGGDLWTTGMPFDDTADRDTMTVDWAKRTSLGAYATDSRRSRISLSSLRERWLKTALWLVRRPSRSGNRQQIFLFDSSKLNLVVDLGELPTAGAAILVIGLMHILQIVEPSDGVGGAERITRLGRATADFLNHTYVTALMAPGLIDVR